MLIAHIACRAYSLLLCHCPDCSTSMSRSHANILLTGDVCCTITLGSITTGMLSCLMACAVGGVSYCLPAVCSGCCGRPPQAAVAATAVPSFPDAAAEQPAVHAVGRRRGARLKQCGCTLQRRPALAHDAAAVLAAGPACDKSTVHAPTAATAFASAATAAAATVQPCWAI